MAGRPVSGAGDSRNPVRPVGGVSPRTRGGSHRPRARHAATGVDRAVPPAGDEAPVAGRRSQDTPPHGQPPVRRDSVRRTGTTAPSVADGETGTTAGAGQGLDGDQDGLAGSVRPRRLGHLGPVSPYHVRRRHRLARRTRLLLTLSGIVVLVLVGAAVWYETLANPSGGPGKRVLIHVKQNEPVGAVTSTLAQKGVISSGFAFQLSLLLHGTPTVRPGGYSLRTNQSFGAVRGELAAGPNVFLVTVPPGFTISEIAGVLATAPGNLSTSFVTEAKSGAVASPYQPAPGASLEGLLGTGTYELAPGETAGQLLTQMVRRFDSEAARAGVTPAAAATLGYTPYQLVTVASIAQKEGYYHRYMPQVARVIYNRLAQGMPLAMTATVLYALNQDGGSVTSADQKVTSPYNTYLHTGLTPTPICTPSPTALSAAAKPPAGAWLYFELVTAKKGVMVFSTTFTQQLQAERQAQANSAQGSG